jgi:hypothetical protein
LQNKKLVFNINEIGKEIEKVDRDLPNLGYSIHIPIKELTKEVNRINIASGRNIFEYGVETDD